MAELITPQLEPGATSPRSAGLDDKTQHAHNRLIPEFILWVWGVIVHPWLLIIIGSGTVVLLLCALLLPQLPGQIRQEPTAATRWLLGASAEYGWPGNLLRGLGLFDVLHSPLLQLFVALLGLILLLRLGNEIAALWHFHRLQECFATTTEVAAGTPLSLPTLQAIYRWRYATPQPPHALFPKLYEEFQRSYTPVISKECPLAFEPAAAAAALMANSLQVDETAADTQPLPPTLPDVEMRLLGLRHVGWTMMMRPLHLVGLLMALASVWFSISAGWSVSLSALAPGERYRDVAHNITVIYNLAEGTSATQPLTVEIQQMNRQLAVGDSTALDMGQMRVKSRKGAPGLLISSLNGEIVLARRPDQPPIAASMGLIFPSMGSEEFVIVNQQVGLRIVRMSTIPNNGSPLTVANDEDNQFIIEFYAGNSTEPVQRALVTNTQSEVIEVEPANLALRFTPLPSANIEVRYRPGNWLLLPALLLAISGTAGFVRRPAFLLAQLAPWPTERTVIVLQAHDASDLAAVRSWLEELA